MLFGKRDCLSSLQTLFVLLIFNGMAKTKLTILPFLCCGEIVKNYNVSRVYRSKLFTVYISCLFFLLVQLLPIESTRQILKAGMFR